MKYPWQYWGIFLTALAIVLSAMSWLTFKALELDRAESLARRQAKLEENVGRALWRMDAAMMPHLAREAARPYSVYQSILQGPAGGNSQTFAAQLSPLLTDRSEYVFVNFEVNSGDVWSSPQTPTGATSELACNSGASADEILQCTEMLSRLRNRVSYEALSASLPIESLAPMEGAVDNTNSTGRFVQNSFVDVDQLQQQQLAAPLGANSRRNDSAVSQQMTSSPQAASPRGYNDLSNRAAALQSFAQKEVLDQRANVALWSFEPVQEGISQPMWIGSELLLARRVEVEDQVVIQGCWLDWPRIRNKLVAEVSDLLPRLDLEPVTDPQRAQFSRMLATLPVQLVVPPPQAEPASWSAMRIALAAAWSCLLMASMAAAVLLHGVLALSERRAAFVSAVTHELRTPLTTFRMYSEMLSQGMVPDEAKRQRYLRTLRIEADRLSHLVENVLAYARLERGRPTGRFEEVSVATLVNRMQARLRERAAQAAMELVIEASPPADCTRLGTDAQAVEQILFNLVDNACKYAAAAADRRIHLQVNTRGNTVRFVVRDHGAGVAKHEVRQLFRPFSKSAQEAANSAPGVGLGLALCRRLANELGGQLEWQPNDEAGASFALILNREH